jgi:hypothetical protein
VVVGDGEVKIRRWEADVADDAEEPACVSVHCLSASLLASGDLSHRIPETDHCKTANI